MKNLLLLAVVACSIASAAQTSAVGSPTKSPSAATSSSQASLEEVNQLLTVLKSRQQMENALQSLTEQMKRGELQGFELSLQKKGVTLTQAERERARVRLDAIVDEMFKEMPFDEMMQASAEIYRKHFTSQDVAALLAFYRSPIGQRFLTEMPALMQESMRAGGDIMSKRMPEIMERVEQRANELATEFSKDTPAPSKEQ